MTQKLSLDARAVGEEPVELFLMYSYVHQHKRFSVFVYLFFHVFS